MSEKVTEMNAAQVLEFKDISMSINDIITLVKTINTPRAIGILSIIEYMQSAGEPDDKIKRVLLAGARIKV